MPHLDRPVRALRPFISLERLHALGDGIFAFALTLLALDLRVAPTTPAGLAHALTELGPRLLIFLLSFVVIAEQWNVRQRTLLLVARGDGAFVWLNLLSLLFVALLPASADTLGRYPAQPLAMACFGSNMFLFGLMSWLMWRHAARDNRLLIDNPNPALVQTVSRLWLTSPVLFAVTIPLAFWSIYPVYCFWVFLPIVSYIVVYKRLRRLHAEQATRSSA